MTKTEFALRLKNGCASVIAAEAELTEIDSRFGDADHGLTMTKIANAISGAVEQEDGDIKSMLDDAAMAVMTLNGGSAVPLWNTWLDGMQEAAPAGGGDRRAGPSGYLCPGSGGAGQHIRGQGGGQDHDGHPDSRQSSHCGLQRQR